MAYTGENRRIHRVFVTRNTEYHLRKELCVAVRDRHSGQWLQSHAAIRGRLCGGIRFGAGTVVPNAGAPRVGESLYFRAVGRDLVTSTVLAVRRPPRVVVSSYPM